MLMVGLFGSSGSTLKLMNTVTILAAGPVSVMVLVPLRIQFAIVILQLMSVIPCETAISNFRPVRLTVCDSTEIFSPV